MVSYYTNQFLHIIQANKKVQLGLWGPAVLILIKYYVLH